MFCKYCGSKITDDSVFCFNCGKKVKEENADSSLDFLNKTTDNDSANGQDNASDQQSGAPADAAAGQGGASNEQADSSNEDNANRNSESSNENAANSNDDAEEENIEEEASETVNETSSENVSKGEWVPLNKVLKVKSEDTNPLCIAGLVLTILMFFFNYCGLVGFAAIILSLLGYKAAKKNGQKGTMMAIVCMAVAGIISLIFIIRLIEYNRYESAVYGGINGVLEWLDDL